MSDEIKDRLAKMMKSHVFDNENVWSPTLELAAEAITPLVTELVEALEQIAVYGCGMLSQPAAMNEPEIVWLTRRLAEYERVARKALTKAAGG